MTPRWRFVTLAIWAATAGVCAADTIKADSRITAVTVFPDRAGVTRTAALTLEPGAHTVEIAPLPSRVEPQSVNARGEGQAAVTLYGVRVITRQLEAAQDPKAQALEEEIRQATQRQQQLQDLKQVLAQERQYLASIQAASGEQIGKDLITKSPSAQDAAALLGFLDESLLKTFQRDQEAGNELESLSRQLDKLRRELATLTEGRTRQETALLVDLEARTGGPFRLAVSYRVPGARWEPAYEARAASDADRVDLLLAGLVRQQTGEDWVEAQVTLSTANPALGGSLPELQPVFLKPVEAIPAAPLGVLRRSFDIAQQTSYAKVALSEEKAEAPGQVVGGEAVPASATIAMQGPSVTYQLPKAETILADGQPHKVSIGAQAFQANLTYGTTPRLLPYAFLRARVKNTAGQFFLAGPVAVFLDGAFIATASLKQIAPEEEFDLYLGVDERVKVERRTLKERVEISLLPGLRGKTKSTDYEYLTTLSNFTGRRITVTAFDLVPVSQREEIIVESVHLVPAEVEKIEERPGVFRWQLDLAPNQKQELRVAYRVRHPVDMIIQ